MEKFALEEGNLKLQIRKADKRKTAAAEAVCSENPRKEEKKESGVQIKAPLVGTFYTAPSPEEGNFVQVGDHVEKGQTLGIIEAMKLMNEIQKMCIRDRNAPAQAKAALDMALSTLEGGKQEDVVVDTELITKDNVDKWLEIHEKSGNMK